MTCHPTDSTHLGPPWTLGLSDIIHTGCGYRCRLCRTDETYSKQHMLVGTEVGDAMSMGSSSLAVHIEGAKKPELGVEEPCYSQKCELRYIYTLYISIYIYIYIIHIHTTSYYNVTVY